MACSSIVLGAPTEKTPEATSTPSEIASFWTPLLSEFPLPGVGGGGGGAVGVWIFSGTAYFVLGLTFIFFCSGYGNI